MSTGKIWNKCLFDSFRLSACWRPVQSGTRAVYFTFRFRIFQRKTTMLMVRSHKMLPLYGRRMILFSTISKYDLLKSNSLTGWVGSGHESSGDRMINVWFIRSNSVRWLQWDHVGTVRVPWGCHKGTIRAPHVRSIVRSPWWPCEGRGVTYCHSTLGAKTFCSSRKMTARSPYNI